MPEKKHSANHVALGKEPVSGSACVVVKLDEQIVTAVKDIMREQYACILVNNNDRQYWTV